MNHHLSQLAADVNRVLIAQRLPCTHRISTRMKSMTRIASKPREVKDQLGIRVVYSPSNRDEVAYRMADSVAESFGAWVTRDYIANPKGDTGYRSIHMLIPLMEMTAELQIRDAEMHWDAEFDGYHDRALFCDLHTKRVCCQTCHSDLLWLPFSSSSHSSFSSPC